MKYTIEQWKEKIRKDKEKESLNMSYLIAEMYKSLIILKTE